MTDIEMDQEIFNKFEDLKKENADLKKQVEKLERGFEGLMKIIESQAYKNKIEYVCDVCPVEKKCKLNLCGSLKKHFLNEGE
jgi:hypothetical protein